MKIKLLHDGGYGDMENVKFPVEVEGKDWGGMGCDVTGAEIMRVGGNLGEWEPNTLYYWDNNEIQRCVEDISPYAYEVTTNRGHKYLVYANSTEYDNAVMFGYELKPLYEGE